MDRELILTQDGSHSIAMPASGVSYHSRFGAITESMHVFIDSGLRPVLQAKPMLKVMEVGFGTGLNALLTWMEIEAGNREIYFEAIEPFPLETHFISSLNYCAQLTRPDLQELFDRLHKAAWNRWTDISPRFHLKKHLVRLDQLSMARGHVDLVYFDAFAPVAQPELWTNIVFEKLFDLLSPGGCVVTYCAKGDVRRTMQAAGFIVQKLPGPPGKREIIRAFKPFR
ncbi:MAG TPA: tRNA (5-methylaminomethyl-2-thiouridine)(34)-methyltransferase MnmD [Puia sp.]|nr:tRNA (5-methylaminomethyl-2-thiouridine)(34)-methyltransferase MnmD [Puia sp.]